jgi:hypothetical protein
MAETKSWVPANDALWGFREFVKEQEFETI